MEWTKKARFEYINSTFEGICINNMQERQNTFNNHFISILSKSIAMFCSKIKTFISSTSMF